MDICSKIIDDMNGITMSAKGHPNGEAYVECETQEDTKRLQKSNDHLGSIEAHKQPTTSKSAMSIVKLRSSDGELIEVNVEFINLSSTLRQMKEELEKDGHIVLNKVKACTLKKVIKWVIHHKNDGPPQVETPNEDGLYNLSLDKFDEELLCVENEELFEIMFAAKFFDIQGLFDVCVKSFSKKIRGKTPDQLYQLFKIRSSKFSQS